MDLFLSASHLSIKSENDSPASTGPDSSEEALIWSEENLLESFMRDPFDMDDPFLAVNLNDFPLPTLEGSSKVLDLILVNGHGASIVLAAEVSGEWCAHQHSLDTRRYREVSLPTLLAGA
ncbi:hypothetical protein AAG906_017121 [Vitis piasezkii]